MATEVRNNLQTICIFLLCVVRVLRARTEVAKSSLHSVVVTSGANREFNRLQVGRTDSELKRDTRIVFHFSNRLRLAQPSSCRYVLGIFRLRLLLSVRYRIMRRQSI